jgi:hypothetical protein
MITLPLLLSGAVLGVATGKWLPKIAIVIFLFAILMSVFLKTKKLFLKTREKEDNQQLIPIEMKNLSVTIQEATITKEL